MRGTSEPQTGFYRTFRIEPPPFQVALSKLSLYIAQRSQEWNFPTPCTCVKMEPFVLLAFLPLFCSHFCFRLAGFARPRQGTEICNFGERLHFFEISPVDFFGFFSRCSVCNLVGNRPPKCGANRLTSGQRKKRRIL